MVVTGEITGTPFEHIFNSGFRDQWSFGQGYQRRECKFRSRLRMLHSRPCRICHPPWQGLGTFSSSKKKPQKNHHKQVPWLKGNCYLPHPSMIFQYINSELKIAYPAYQDRVVLFLRERRSINLFVVFCVVGFWFFFSLMRNWSSQMVETNSSSDLKKLPKKIKPDLKFSFSTAALMSCHK